jgi:hypothetical protein
MSPDGGRSAQKTGKVGLQGREHALDHRAPPSDGDRLRLSIRQFRLYPCLGWHRCAEGILEQEAKNQGGHLFSSVRKSGWHTAGFSLHLIV